MHIFFKIFHHSKELLLDDVNDSLDYQSICFERRAMPCHVMQHPILSCHFLSFLVAASRASSAFVAINMILNYKLG